MEQRSSFNKKRKNKRYKYFAVEMLGKSLLTIKKYFQMHKLRLSFLKPQNTQIILLLLGNIKVHIKKNVKRYFQPHQ